MLFKVWKTNDANEVSSLVHSFTDPILLYVQFQHMRWNALQLLMWSSAMKKLEGEKDLEPMMSCGRSQGGCKLTSSQYKTKNSVSSIRGLGVKRWRNLIAERVYGREQRKLWTHDYMFYQLKATLESREIWATGGASADNLIKINTLSSFAKPLTLKERLGAWKKKCSIKELNTLDKARKTKKSKKSADKWEPEKMWRGKKGECGGGGGEWGQTAL